MPLPTLSPASRIACAFGAGLSLVPSLFLVHLAPEYGGRHLQMFSPTHVPPFLHGLFAQ